jgi:hypothetical protein
MARRRGLGTLPASNVNTANWQDWEEQGPPAPGYRTLADKTGQIGQQPTGSIYGTTNTQAQTPNQDTEVNSLVDLLQTRGGPAGGGFQIEPWHILAAGAGVLALFFIMKQKG